jgi:hypothetical protein
MAKRVIMYANPTGQEKQIAVTSLSRNIKAKHPLIRIQPYSSGEVALRIYYDHRESKNQEGAIQIDDGNLVEELLFQFCLKD